MRFNLYSITLVSALVASSISHAELGVKLGGTMDVMTGGRSEKPEYRYIYQKNPMDKRQAYSKKSIVTDGRININIDSKDEGDFKYGGLLVLNANPSDSTTGEKGLVSRDMIYVQHNKFGRLEAGNYYGAGGMFEMTPTNFAKAGYGVHGYWSSWINNAAYIDLSTIGVGKKYYPNLMGHKYLSSPNLPSNYSGEHYAAAPKVTYYTIPFPGVTFGVSYIPDLDSTGTISTQAGAQSGPKDEGRKMNRPTFKNIFSGGFMYEFDVKDVNIKTSVTGEVGKAKKYAGTNFVNDLKAYEIGFGAVYNQYSIGATYGNWGKTGTYREKYKGTKQGADYWTAVFAHDTEVFGYSLSYMQSKRAGGLEPIGSNLHYELSGRTGKPIKDKTFSDTKYNKLKVVSLGIDYKMAPGLMPYAEATRFVFKDASAPKSNAGYIFLTGVRLKF